MRFGEDENGAYKLLNDGRALRAKRQIFNAILTLSKSRAAMTWIEGW